MKTVTSLMNSWSYLLIKKPISITAVWGGNTRVQCRFLTTFWYSLCQKEIRKEKQDEFEDETEKGRVMTANGLAHQQTPSTSL